MSKLASLKICIKCGGVYSIHPMAFTKNQCPKCKGILVP